MILKCRIYTNEVLTVLRESSLQIFALQNSTQSKVQEDQRFQKDMESARFGFKGKELTSVQSQRS